MDGIQQHRRSNNQTVWINLQYSDNPNGKKMIENTTDTSKVEPTWAARVEYPKSCRDP